MRNFATAAVAVAVVWAGLWALWQPDFAFSQGQAGAAPEQAMAASCGGMMGGMMNSGGENHHGMGPAGPAVAMQSPMTGSGTPTSVPSAEAGDMAQMLQGPIPPWGIYVVPQLPVVLAPHYEARLGALDQRMDDVQAHLDAHAPQ